MLKGIDVSEHQGNINWNLVKNQIDFAILRVGYGGNMSTQDDKQFIRNATECTRLGIPFGSYIYSYADSIQKAKSEAQHVLRLIKNYKLSYPVYLDLEDNNTVGKCNNKQIADIAQAFCSIIEKAGYFVGIYANTYWFNNKLTDSRFNCWTRWVAQYSNKCTCNDTHSIWQYTSEGTLNGIASNVDMNYCYIDYPGVINNKKNNKASKQSNATLVTYLGDADLFAAIILSQKLNCPIMRYIDFKNSTLKFDKIIKVGGKVNSTRFTTFKDVAKLV